MTTFSKNEMAIASENETSNFSEKEMENSSEKEIRIFSEEEILENLGLFHRFIRLDRMIPSLLSCVSPGEYEYWVAALNKCRKVIEERGYTPQEVFENEKAIEELAFQKPELVSRQLIRLKYK